MWPVVVYVMVMALISLISVSLAPETYRRDLKHIQDENHAVQVELLRKILHRYLSREPLLNLVQREPGY